MADGWCSLPDPAFAKKAPRSKTRPACLRRKNCQMTADRNLSPKGLRAVEMVKSGEGQSTIITRAPGVYESRGVGNSYLLTTPDGDVLVNAGTLGDARRGRELFATVSKGPIRYIVL